MPRVAFLTTDNLEDFFVYDHLCFKPLSSLGWEAQEISWQDTDVNWDDFDVVVIRSTWDYQDTPAKFLAVLEQIDQSRANLQNSLSVVKWNINKEYLRDLQKQNVAIVPTLWFAGYDHKELEQAFAKLGCDEIVIKPTISANADHTYRLTRSRLSDSQAELASIFSERSYMVQPFLNSVIDEGEYSLFYFGGKYSHCILKVPKKNDFRVQEEHGGQLHSIDATPEQKQIADKALLAIPEEPLYARVDLIRVNDSFAVMEIELIEPSLYFNMDSDAAGRFATALVKRYT